MTSCDQSTVPESPRTVGEDDVADTAPVERRRTSRRAFLIAGATALVGGGAAVAVLGTRDARPPQVEPPAPEPRPAPLTPLDQVLADADATAGRRLMGSPWSDWFGGAPAAWSAVYVSWLLRDHGVPKTDDVAALYDWFVQRGSVRSGPQPGALIFYARGPVPPHHVGLVTSVTQGVPQTLEGDHPMNLAYEERFVRRFARPWDAEISYAYPAYG